MEAELTAREACLILFRVSRRCRVFNSLRSLSSCPARSSMSSWYQMCFAARILGNSEAAQGSELHVQIANSARSAANPAQQLQELFLLPIAGREEPQKESLQTAASGPEAVNGFGFASAASRSRARSILWKMKLPPLRAMLIAA